MSERPLRTSPDLKQVLVQELARLSKSTPWLARALARANQVSEQMDLETAARTAAVVETLDQIANTNVDEFLQARSAIITSDVPSARESTPAVPQELGGTLASPARRVGPPVAAAAVVSAGTAYGAGRVLFRARKKAIGSAVLLRRMIGSAGQFLQDTAQTRVPCRVSAIAAGPRETTAGPHRPASVVVGHRGWRMWWTRLRMGAIGLTRAMARVASGRRGTWR